MTQIKGYEDAVNINAIQRVIDAWEIEGPAPFVHNYAKGKLRREWPTLAEAMEMLIRQYKSPILRYILKAHYQHVFDPIQSIHVEQGYDTWDELSRAEKCLLGNMQRMNWVIHDYNVLTSLDIIHTGRYRDNGKR